MVSPLPTVNDTYFVPSQEENHRLVSGCGSINVDIAYPIVLYYANQN